MTNIALLMMSTAAMLGTSGSAPPHCLRALQPISASTAARSSDFEQAPCPSGKVLRPYRYDIAHGATQVTQGLQVGAVVGTFPEFGISMIRTGDVLELVGKAGAVTIERDVKALQPARHGQRLFVRSSDGEVLSVRYEDMMR